MRQVEANEVETRTKIYANKELTCKILERKLAAWQGQDRNKDLIDKYRKYLAAKETKEGRRVKVGAELRNICDYIKKDLDTLKKEDVMNIIGWINDRKDYRDATKTDYRRAVKEFFRWYRDEDPRINDKTHTDDEENARIEALKMYKYLDKSVSGAYSPQKVNYAEIITDEDCKQLMDKGCINNFERAMIATLHESGIRVGELLGMRIRDIEFKEPHSVIRVDGKTGERPVPILRAVPYLQRWIDEHPAKDNTAALVWVSTHNGSYGRPLCYRGVQKLLKRVFAQAGVKKRRNAHWMRHSRATIWAPKYREPVLCKLMGWSIGSKQAATYVHMGADQVEKEFLTVNGIMKQEEKATPSIVSCICGCTNTPEARYCYRCGKPMNVAIAVEDEHLKKVAIDEAFEMFQKILSNPETLKKFKEYSRQNGGRA